MYLFLHNSYIEDKKFLEQDENVSGSSGFRKMGRRNSTELKLKFFLEFRAELAEPNAEQLSSYLRWTVKFFLAYKPSFSTL